MTNQNGTATDAKTPTTKASWIALFITAFTAAIPGFYSAWEAAKNAHQAKKNAQQAKQEREVRDKQEEDLHKFTKALEAELKALKASCVTHKDLLELALKLQNSMRNSFTSSAYNRARTHFLLKKIQMLRRKMYAAKSALKKAKQVRKPSLQRADQVRKKILQQKETPSKK